jgi:G:T-mismatch repair DNA endonuclease (very short patch repair protein)
MTYAEFVALQTGEEPLQCCLCGLRSNNLNSHITRVHMMTIDDYRTMFPGAETCRLTIVQVDRMKTTKQNKDSFNQINRRAVLLRKEETLATGAAMLVCGICGFESANSLIAHITKRHSTTMNDYRARFPSQRVQQASPTQRRNNSRAMKKRLQDPDAMAAFLEWRSFPSEVKHWIRKGMTPKEAQLRVTEFQLRASAGQNNPETRQRQSEMTAGDANPMSLSSIATREGVSMREARMLTPCYGRTGEAHPMFGKKHTADAIAKIGQQLTQSNVSDIERQCSELLIERVGEARRNEHLAGFCCDLIFTQKRLIVEFFGDFWHHNPVKYSSTWTNPLTKRNSEQVWLRDAKKLAALKEAGYEVIVIWECEWHNYRDACVRRVKDAYDRA